MANLAKGDAERQRGFAMAEQLRIGAIQARAAAETASRGKEEIKTANVAPKYGGGKVPKTYAQMSDYGIGSKDEYNKQLAANQPAKPPTPEEFLAQTLNKAQAASPWKNKLPTPVGLSGPGTSTYIREYGAALAALTGMSPQLYMEEARASQPMGLTGAPTRRTR